MSNQVALIKENMQINSNCFNLVRIPDQRKQTKYCKHKRKRNGWSGGGFACTDLFVDIVRS